MISMAVMRPSMKGRAALLLAIATTNLFDRLDVATRQPAGVGW